MSGRTPPLAPTESPPEVVPAPVPLGMPDLNPFTAFNPSVDPVTADHYGLTVLEKLEEGKTLMGEGDSETNDKLRAGQKTLVENLSRYREYKEGRREELFSYEPEVHARNNAFGEEQLARSATRLLQADDASFASILKENGDSEDYHRAGRFMKDQSSMRGMYSVRKILGQAGYSPQQIASGAAEPHMREWIGAHEDQSEPTRGAILRWGLDKINEVDRRRDIEQAAGQGAMNQFLGMKGSEESLEEELAKNFNNLTNAERTSIRRIHNLQYAKMEESFAHIKPLVRKTFNTIALLEGIPTNFKDEGDEAFMDGSGTAPRMRHAIEALGALPRDDFGRVLDMLARTVEAHGQDVDGFMAKVGKSYTRAAEGVGERIVQTMEMVEPNRELTRAKEGKQVFELYNAKTGDVIKQTTREVKGWHWGTDSWEIGVKPRNKLTRHGVTSHIKGFIAKKEIGGVATQIPFEKWTDLKWRAMDAKDGIAALEVPITENAVRSRLRNWREEVARVQSDNWVVNDWVYGSVASLPEMTLAAFGAPGIMPLHRRNATWHRSVGRTQMVIGRNTEIQQWWRGHSILSSTGCSSSLSPKGCQQQQPSKENF